jgi:hypothetical protein
VRALGWASAAACRFERSYIRALTLLDLHRERSAERAHTQDRQYELAFVQELGRAARVDLPVCKIALEDVTRGALHAAEELVVEVVCGGRGRLDCSARRDRAQRFHHARSRSDAAPRGEQLLQTLKRDILESASKASQLPVASSEGGSSGAAPFTIPISGGVRSEPDGAHPWSAGAGCLPGSMLMRQGKLHGARLPLAQTAERFNLLTSEFNKAGLARGSLRMTTGTGARRTRIRRRGAVVCASKALFAMNPSSRAYDLRLGESVRHLQPKAISTFPTVP